MDDDPGRWSHAAMRSPVVAVTSAALIGGAATAGCGGDIITLEAGEDGPTGDGTSGANRTGGAAGGPGSGDADDDGGEVGVAPFPDAVAVGPEGGMACNSFVDTAPVITGELATGPYPKGKGGVVPAGTYYLTSALYYAGLVPKTPVNDEWHLALTATGYELQLASLPVAAPSPPAWRATFAATFSGITMKLKQTCPGPEIAAEYTYTYDTATSTLTIYYSASGSDVAVVYTLE
jgi:hypothetical protein